jgi:hypothetical protein
MARTKNTTTKNLRKAIKLSTPAFRVLRFTEPQREQFRSTRDKANLTNLDYVTLAVRDKLPKLVDALATLGVVREDGKRRPVRLPITDTTLAAVREASNNTGLPSVLILRLCLTSPRKQRKAKSFRDIFFCRIKSNKHTAVYLPE